MGDWRRLRSEHEELGVGPLLMAEIESVARSTTRKYPPTIYASSGEWSSSLEDLVADVAEALLSNDRHQLSYVMTVANDIPSLRKLLGLQVRRVLSRGRRRTVVDNLLDRCRVVLERDYIRRGTLGGRVVYTSAGPSDVSIDPPTDEMRRRAATMVRKIPKAPPPKGERAPKVYTQGSLEQLLRIVAEILPSGFTERDLAMILEDVLTDWIPIVLREDEGAAGRPTVDWTDEDSSLAGDSAQHALDRLNDAQRRALALWQQGRTHVEIAAALGCSRPTAAKRMEEAIHLLRDDLNELSYAEQKIAIDLISILLEREHPR